MEQVETAARAHYSLASAFPAAPVGNQFNLRNDLSQTPVRRTVPLETAEQLILSCARGRFPAGGIAVAGQNAIGAPIGSQAAMQRKRLFTAVAGV